MSKMFVITARVIALVCIFSIAKMYGQELLCTEPFESIEDNEQEAVSGMNALGLDLHKRKVLHTFPSSVVRIENKALLLYCGNNKHYVICHVAGCQATFEQVCFDNVLYAIQQHLQNVHRYNPAKALMDVPHIK